MRPSNKSRSRNKPGNLGNNAGNGGGANRRSVGNIINRVFESAGPDGKVRGTPQQIIDKYQALARDAQLAGDRVAAESFLQHSEHYSRLLGEAVAQHGDQRPAFDRDDLRDDRGDGYQDQARDGQFRDGWRENGPRDQQAREPAREGVRDQNGRELNGREPIGREPIGREQGGRDQGGREQGGREQGGPEQGGRAQGGREQGGPDHGGRAPNSVEQGRREQGGRETGREQGREGRDQASRDSGREREPAQEQRRDLSRDQQRPQPKPAIASSLTTIDTDEDSDGDLGGLIDTPESGALAAPPLAVEPARPAVVNGTGHPPAEASPPAPEPVLAEAALPNNSAPEDERAAEPAATVGVEPAPKKRGRPRKKAPAAEPGKVIPPVE